MDKLEGEINLCWGTAKNNRRPVIMENYRKRNEWISHIMWHEGLLKLIIERNVVEKNYRRKPRLVYIQKKKKKIRD